MSRRPDSHALTAKRLRAILSYEPAHRLFYEASFDGKCAGGRDCRLAQRARASADQD